MVLFSCYNSLTANKKWPLSIQYVFISLEKLIRVIDFFYFLIFSLFFLVRVFIFPGLHMFFVDLNDNFSCKEN